MDLVLDIPVYYKEQFLEYVNNNSSLKVECHIQSRSGGLNIATPELIAVVSTTVTAIELARLLVTWLRGVSEDKVIIKTKTIEADITIKKGISEEEAAKLITKLADIDED
ncbi:hypothetical protein [Methylomonas sp. UP202]|uniref:hypothetical protein n=1 Tax=Methylomonas sp. UP202 TaxID=3040943 RepID=UPI00247AAF07|nr:hypothetical protein [Methylomonas sp. UP202]WGS84727.1 hypothetical protein QC632_16910 [Methylomonas sp. UP202]